MEINTKALGFGGLSALHLDDALVLTAISDTGRWFRAQLLLRGETPAGLGPATTGLLRDGSGETL
ncbi:MAG: twin-arginine translocation pathway signal, partial [Alphaproteobacteria bacterium]|nr:twin-arginine translocation pathway signal [Alphaproteobacteria bacterium]